MIIARLVAKIPSAPIDAPGLRILLTLAYYHRKKLSATMKRLALDAGVSTATTTRVVSKLRQQSLVVVKTRGREKIVYTTKAVSEISDIVTF